MKSGKCTACDVHQVHLQQEGLSERQDESEFEEGEGEDEGDEGEDEGEEEDGERLIYDISSSGSCEIAAARATFDSDYRVQSEGIGTDTVRQPSLFVGAAPFQSVSGMDLSSISSSSQSSSSGLASIFRTGLQTDIPDSGHEYFQNPLSSPFPERAAVYSLVNRPTPCSSEGAVDKLRDAMARLSERTTHQRTEVWDHFRRWSSLEVKGDSNKDYETVCLLCLEQGNALIRGCPEKCTVKYGRDRCTGNLKKHIQHKHTALHNANVMREAAAKPSNSTSSLKSGTLHKFVNSSPDYFDAHLKWVIQTYQPLSTCSTPSYKAMIHSLNPKAQTVTREALTLCEFILLCMLLYCCISCLHVLTSVRDCML